VEKNAVSGSIALDWSGGVAPYTLIRSEDPKLISGRTVILDESYYYLVP